MKTQQKIEFYLSKGFAVEVEWGECCKAIYYFEINGDFYGKDPNFNENKAYPNGGCLKWSAGNMNPTKLTPIPPKPYEFEVGDKVMVFETGIIHKITSKNGWNYELDHTDYANWWELAPALPEDEECEVIEVVKIPEFYIDELNLTKPDGKKLKIKVIKK